MNKNMDIILKVFILFLIICIFYVLSTKCVEGFIDQDNYFKAFNTRINYRNTGLYPWDRHFIYNSLPNDITMKYDTAYYYEFGNDEYELRLRNIFNNDCKKLIVAVEGTNWSPWMNPRCIISSSENSCNNGISKDLIVEYYNKVFTFISNKINDSNSLMLPDDLLSGKKVKIQIVHDILKRYRFNINQKDYMMIDIEMILYRENKQHGKHVKFYVITNGIDINIIVVKILGLVAEEQIAMHPVLAKDAYDDLNKDFSIFIPEGFKENKIKLEYDKNTTNYNEIYEGTEKLTDSLLEEQLYNKLEENYNAELVDNKKINYEISENINDNNYDIHMKNIDLKYEQQKQDEKNRDNINKYYSQKQLELRKIYMDEINSIDSDKNKYKLNSFKNIDDKKYTIL